VRVGGGWLGEVEGLNRKNTVLVFCFLILDICFEFGLGLGLGLGFGFRLVSGFGRRFWL